MRPLVRALVLAALIPAAGCGGGGDPVTVRGTVTLNDQPVGGAVIQFFPPSATTPAFTGTSKPDGTYEIVVPAETKAPAGSYKVTVAKYEPKKGGKGAPNTEGMDPTQLKMMGLAANVLPPAYENAQNALLTVEIKPGQVTGDLKLSWALKK